MRILGATGNGYGAKVNVENQLHTSSITFDIAHHVNHDHGECYTMLISKTPTAAADCFAYIKNTSDDDLIVCCVKFAATTTDEIIQVKLGDIGTPVGGTAVTPGNRNAGSGEVADGTFEEGVDITGLSGGTAIDEYNIDAGTGSKIIPVTGGFIVPKNKVLSLYAVTGGIAIRGGITFYYHSSY